MNNDRPGISTGLFTCTFFIIAYGVTQLYIYCIIVYIHYVLSCSVFATSWTVARRLLCPWGFSRQEYQSGLPCLLSGDFFDTGIEPGCPALQADSLPSEPPGKPKNAGVSCHALLQGIFPTQGSNPGLLHCRWVLYRLSHQGSPLHLYTLGCSLYACLCVERGRAMKPQWKMLARSLLDQIRLNLIPNCENSQNLYQVSPENFWKRLELLVLRPEEIQQWCVKTF